MPVIETRDGIFLEIPDGMDPNSPEVREAVVTERTGRTRRRMESPEFKERVATQQAEDRKTYDPTVGMSGMDKTLANIGAGVDTTMQGLRQLVPGVKGPTDEELREKRERDATLARSADLGVGADWMPSAGSALQVGGELLPTLIPGAAATKLPRALQLMRARPVATGIAGGAGAAGLMPTTSDESRAANMALGGAAGAVLPLGVAGYRGARKMVGARTRAGERLVEGLGDEAAGMESRVAAREAERDARSAAAREIPESLAEATGSVRAAGLESMSARNPATNPDWAAFKAGQNVARHEGVQRATAESDRLFDRSSARDLVSDPMRTEALRTARKDKWFHQPVQQVAQDILSSDDAVNPAVRRVADLVLSSMDERAPKQITPAGLYNMRKLLTDKLHGPAQIGDELSAAVKGADRQTMQLVEAIDQSLNQASGGRWQRYLDTYKRASTPVDQAKAAQLAREVFEREGIPEMGGVPEVTATRLGQAMRASEGGARKFPLTLSPGARAGLEDIGEHISRANEPQKLRKLAGSAGGGSQTSTDLAMTGLQMATGIPINVERAAFNWLGRGANEATQRELASMLQNPQLAIAAIKEAQRLRQPLSQAQTALMQAMSQAAGGGLPRAMQSRQQEMR